MRPVVYNPYIYKKIYFIESNEGLIEFVEKLEKRTGLKFMARQENEALHGFVTKFPEGIIVALYAVGKRPDEESPHFFKRVEVTKELERKIYG